MLIDETWSGVGEVPLLGPEDLSFNDMAETMSEVLGKDVRFQQTTFEAYKERFVSFGISDAMAQGMTDMAWAKNEGLDNGVSGRQRTRRRRASASGAKRSSSRPSRRPKSRSKRFGDTLVPHQGARRTMSAIHASAVLVPMPGLRAK